MTRAPFRFVAAAAAATVVSASPLAAQQPVPAALDSAVREMDVGRYWHATRILRDLQNRQTLGPEQLLLLARAEAGYKAWPAVVELLQGKPWLGSTGGGAGWRLLGRALEGLERWQGAAEAYDRWLASPDAGDAWARSAVEARRVRTLALAGAEGQAVALLDGLSGEAASLLSSWTALGLARTAAEDGDTASLRSLLAAVDDEEARRRSWELPARGRLAAGDTAGAVAEYRGGLDAPGASLSTGSRARAWSVLGRLLLARRDTAAARTALRNAWDAAPNTSDGVDAAERLVALGALEGEPLLAAARALDRADRDAPALRAYDRWVAAAGDGAGEDARLARAELMAETSGRQDEAVTAFRALSTSADPAVGARALESWAGLRRRQGRTGDVATLRGWLLERYPASAQAVEVVFFRGDAAHDRNELDAAYRYYAELQAMNPAINRSGLARMRMGMIRLHQGRREEALEVFRGYLGAFPEGRRWDEASYWAGRILLAQGREEEGRRLLGAIAPRDPTSFYALEAAKLLGEPFRLPGMEDTAVPPAPAWLDAGLARVDLLAAAGLEEGRAVEVERLTRRARATSGDAVLRLAMALIERDLGLDGVNLGWELRREGRPWSRALWRVTYPFPFRALVEREARERAVDPLWVAALIRQESAFDPDIHSSAGAIGLMQVMPETGRGLARTHGPDDFRAESLETPEVNLHLGTAYMRDMWQRYDGRIPLILSAYNAGPHRANAWKEFPEAADPLRLTERIPFGETRDYVKLVSRNRAIYGALWGGE